jgi:uncharacterized protein
MMRTGVPGLLLGLLSFAIVLAANWLFRGWVLRRFPLEGARRTWLTIVLAILTLTAPIGRSLVGLNYNDRFAWIEAVGLLWGLALLLALPVLLVLERAVKAAKIDPERRETLQRIVGGTVVAASVTPLVHGVFTRFEFDVVELPIKIGKLPKALDGFTIAQISDIHIGVYLGDRELRRAEDVIGGFKPDLVVMTGDLVHLRPSYLPMGVDWVRRLGERARHGSLSILGNHEYYVGRREVVEAYRRAGLPMLINESRIIDGIGFGAVDDSFAPSRGAEGPNLDKALAQLRDDAPRILLAHQPIVFTEAAPRVDLQLSGHTHGGQIAPLGPVVASAIYKGRCAGIYRSGASTLYVNRGFGTSGPPSRVAVRPEITKIVLVSG